VHKVQAPEWYTGIPVLVHWVAIAALRMAAGRFALRFCAFVYACVCLCVCVCECIQHKLRTLKFIWNPLNIRDAPTRLLANILIADIN